LSFQDGHDIDQTIGNRQEGAMKFQCPGCHVGYRIDDEKIPEKGTHIRCRKCETRFFLTRSGVKESLHAAVPVCPPEENGVASGDGADLQDLEVKLQACLQAGDEAAAAGVLLDMVDRCAKNRDFQQAEACRDRMYDVTPMALNEVLKAGEMIEEEKSQAMDTDHTNRWSQLYESLSSEEASTLFFSMTDRPMAKGESFYEQGHVSGAMCFVEEGQLEIICALPNDEPAAVKTIGPGEAVGTDLFFSFTVSTYSVVAREDSRVKVLDKASLARWRETQPGIESKLQSFCDRLEAVSDAVVRQDIERRASERKSSRLRAAMQLLDMGGNPSGPSTAVGFSDVSQQGACLEVKLNRREEGRNMLGSLVKISFAVDVSGEEKPVALAARICAVHFHAFGDCTVHIRFRKSMNEKLVDLIADGNGQA
jgi:predicted Zn finger-like uncharacterized protein